MTAERRKAGDLSSGMSKSLKRVHFLDGLFQRTLFFSAFLCILILLVFLITLLLASMPSLKAFGFRFLYGKEWNPVTNEFGSLPFLLGTLYTSFLSLLITFPFVFATGLFLGEYFPKGVVPALIKNIVEMLASIPSIIYGFWGLFVLVPVIRNIEIKAGIAPYGVGILTSSLVLAVMIIPYGVSLSAQVIRMVPGHLKEAAYSLGATRFEVIRRIILPYTFSGLFAGIVLSLGRALGETMAVTMLIGNSHQIPLSIFGPGNTMASVIANEFTEATGTVYLSAIIEIGLILFLVTTLTNIIGRRIIRQFVIR